MFRWRNCPPRVLPDSVNFVENVMYWWWPVSSPLRIINFVWAPEDINRDRVHQNTYIVNCACLSLSHTHRHTHTFLDSGHCKGIIHTSGARCIRLFVPAWRQPDQTPNGNGNDNDTTPLLHCALCLPLSAWTWSGPSYLLFIWLEE